MTELKALYLKLLPRGGALCLPAAYQDQVQGLLYSCWKNTMPELHDGFIDEDGRNRKPFCFSRLEGRYLAQGPELTFDSVIGLELRSVFNEIVDGVAQELRERVFLRLGSRELAVSELQLKERLSFPDRAIIQTRSPITVHTTLSNGHMYYFSPENPEWEERLAFNLDSKLNALGCSPPEYFSIEPTGQTRKTVTQFKGTYITGYTGRFRLKTDPSAMAVLYHCGLGSRNSDGFGMFDILER